MTFTEFLQPKRRLYSAIFFAAAISGLLATIVLHWVFLQTPERGFVQGRFGIPWWAATWLAWVVWVMTVPTAMLCFEALLYYSRLDRGDHAWSSLSWSLRTWPLAIVWFVVTCTAKLLLLGPYSFLLGVSDIGGFLAPIASELSDCLLYVVLAFVAWIVRNLDCASPAPLRHWRLRWPDLWPPLLVSATGIASLLLSMTPESAMDGSGTLIGFRISLLVLLAFFLSLAVQVGWLNASGLSLRQTIVVALRPRIFLPVVVLAIRWFAVLGLFLLPVIPVWNLLVMCLPQFQFLLDPSSNIASYWLIEASRKATAYWWLWGIVILQPIALTWNWFEAISSGRLLVELGVVVPTDEASENGSPAFRAV